MDLSKLQRGEFVAIAGGLLLLVGLFLNWYTTKGLGRIDGVAGPQTGWEVHTILRWILLPAAIAPAILGYVIVRDHTLSWPRGELTAVIGIAAFGLIFYNGVLGQPGDSNELTSLQYGWAVSLVGTILMVGGSASRSSKTERRRKPPGTL